MTEEQPRRGRTGGRSGRQAARLAAHVEASPFLTRTLAPFEVLSEEGLAINRIEVNQDGGFTLHPKLEIANVEDTEAEDWITKHKSKTGTKRHANKR